MFKVQGLKPLHGKIKVQGAKNAVLPMMAVSLLTEGRTEIRNVPRISDVFLMAEILRDLGCQVMFQDDVLEIDASGLSGTVISEKTVGKMRSSSLLLGPLLSRAGEVTTWYPGGCVIGKRPIDFHLDVLRAMGAEILDDGGMLIAKAKKLCGTTFRFPYPSVGATENALMAAALASGTTKLLNCAREPEIVELCSFLRSMGAKISGGRGGKALSDGSCDGRRQNLCGDIPGGGSGSRRGDRDHRCGSGGSGRTVKGTPKNGSRDPDIRGDRTESQDRYGDGTASGRGRDRHRAIPGISDGSSVCLSRRGGSGKRGEPV